MEDNEVFEGKKENNRDISNLNNEELPSEGAEKLLSGSKKLAFMMERSVSSGFMPHPLIEKVNEKHIDKILESAEKQDERDYNMAVASNRYTLTYVLLFVGLILFFTWFFGKEDKTLYSHLITALVSLIIGAFGGYNFGYNKGKGSE